MSEYYTQRLSIILSDTYYFNFMNVTHHTNETVYAHVCNRGGGGEYLVLLGLVMVGGVLGFCGSCFA